MGYKKTFAALMVLLTSQLAVLSVQAQDVSPRPTWANVDGRLWWISLGEGGEVWGVNSDYNIFRRNAGGGWDGPTGKLVQISVGASGVWGVNMYKNIYRWNQRINNWDSIGCCLTQVASGKEVWGVNHKDEVFRYRNTAVEPWELMSGRLSQISVSDDGRVVGINRAGTPYEYVNKQWVQLGSIAPVLLRITVGKAGVWAVRCCLVDNIVKWDEVKKRWFSTPGSISQIDSGTYNGRPACATVDNLGFIKIMTP